MLHEICHGFAAYKLGDPTAKRSGRLSLNPLRHIDPFGTVILPAALMLLNMPIFGYAKPVPYDPRYFKDPQKGDLIVGLAGPAANLAQAILGAIVAWAFLGVSQTWAQSSTFFLYFYWMFIPMYVLINLYLMIFNLIPIPPLDGSSIFAVLIPKKSLPKYYQIQQYAMPVLMIILVAVPYIFNVNPFGWFLDVTAGNIANLLLPYSV